MRLTPIKCFKSINASTLKSWFNWENITDSDKGNNANWDSEYTLFDFDMCYASGKNHEALGMDTLADHYGSYVAMASNWDDKAYGNKTTGGFFGYYFVEKLKEGENVSLEFNYADQKANEAAQKNYGESQYPTMKQYNWTNTFFNHDLAITGIDAPSSVMQGETATISVTVENQGDFDENFILKLVDMYTGQTIGSKSIILAADASDTYTFKWDTSGEPIAEHTLKARVVPVEGETETADNTETVTIWVYYQRW